MANKQSPQGKTLEKAQASGRAPSSSTVWGQPGFEAPSEPQSFVWEGDIASAPEWIDKGWAGYDAGPALQVPQGNPSGSGPYTTQTARIGDTVTYTPGPHGTFGGFAIVRAEKTGRQPGPEVELNERTGTPSFRPAAQTEADLNDLVRTGLVNPDDMDPEARAQWASRQYQGRVLTAEEAGHIPSNEGPATPDRPNAPQTPGKPDPNVGAPPKGDLPPPRG